MGHRLKMDIYAAGLGAQMTLDWASDKEYELGKKFLNEIGALYFPSSDTDKEPDLFYVGSKEQLDSLLEFRQSLREKKLT